MPAYIFPSLSVLISVSSKLSSSLLSLPLRSSFSSTPSYLCLSVCVGGGISVTLTSLRTDLQRIRNPSDLPVITTIAPISIPVPIIDAVDVDSQNDQKTTLPEEMKRNIEAIGPCTSNSLQLGIGSSVILAVCCLNHS